ncbi:hypothetical protein N656DRAFT_119897 [Canariomyces notabilis]|uniref:Uncharacterized protein n=1 Tax=Canariomyces notabilis TaxID=2074819 RepID=A0AAN6TDB0_9PEZI|nr:hypothetical protein N656DRAFT_119897 [Canariomyces arenarius]
MAKLAMTKYITALDAVAFYQQWLVDPGGRWMFTMATPEAPLPLTFGIETITSRPRLCCFTGKATTSGSHHTSLICSGDYLTARTWSSISRTWQLVTLKIARSGLRFPQGERERKGRRESEEQFSGHCLCSRPAAAESPQVYKPSIR